MPAEGHPAAEGAERIDDHDSAHSEGLITGEDQALDPALIERTRGPQPWRRVFHAANGLVVAAALTRFDPTREQVVVVLAVVLAALVVLDIIRLRVRRANELFFRWFSSLASPREANGVASSTWYALALLLTLGLFPRADAISAILVLALADPAASWIGRRWGRRPFLGGSVEGTLAFLVAAGIVLGLRHPPAQAAVGAVVGALAERLGWPLDDNLAVPLATVAALWVAGYFLM